MVRFENERRESKTGGMPMANYLSKQERMTLRLKVLHAAAKMCLEQGYSHTTTRALAECAGVNVSAMNREFGSKENIFCGLVRFVLDGQFSAAWKLIEGKTEDMVLFYAVETTLQLYMAESSEAARDLYLMAYSLPYASELIHKAVSGSLLPKAFGKYLPGSDQETFNQLEIASGGVIRGYIGVPCSPEFTIEQKAECFLDAALRIYHVPEDKIREAIGFVKQFDLEAIAQSTIDSMLRSLEDPDYPLCVQMFHMDQADPQHMPQRNHSPKEETI